ncbi:MAG: hypothetical protein GYB68_10310 [Chloroflexi bacterium]|nr:hypothetical protein [Chloroflexota bacterium]
MKLRRGHRRVLLALARGDVVKSHRFVSGRKIYRIHPLDGGKSRRVRRKVLEDLMDAGLIYSNKKFPAAAYLLTSRGREQLAGLGIKGVRAVGGVNFLDEHRR